MRAIHTHLREREQMIGFLATPSDSGYLFIMVAYRSILKLANIYALNIQFGGC